MAVLIAGNSTYPIGRKKHVMEELINQLTELTNIIDLLRGRL